MSSTMRNKITIPGDKVYVTFLDLSVGELFRFRDAVNSRPVVYIKSRDEASGKVSGVALTNGNGYTFDGSQLEAKLERVSSLSIQVERS